MIVPHIEWISFAVVTLYCVSDKKDDDDTANTFSSRINFDNIETEGIVPLIAL